MQYGASVSRELPGAVNLTVGYTGSRGKDMFLRGVANTLDNARASRPVPSVGQVDYKTSGCLDGLVINGNADQRLRRAPATTRCRSALTRRFRAGFTGGLQYQYSRNKGTTQGSNEAATAQNTFDYETEYGTQPAGHPAHVQRLARLPCCPVEGCWTGGWRVGGIVNARSGVPINVTISRPDNVTVNGVTVTNIPGGNSRGTQRPDLVPGVEPVPEGRRALAEPGGVRDAAARHVRQPAAQLPARARTSGRLDLMFSKDFRFAHEPGPPAPRRALQHHQPPELREPGGDPAERHAGRAVHRRAGRHVRLHARAAQPHGRSRHRAADADRVRYLF